jgi:hypothetical protein
VGELFTLRFNSVTLTQNHIFVFPGINLSITVICHSSLGQDGWERTGLRQLVSRASGTDDTRTAALDCLQTPDLLRNNSATFGQVGWREQDLWAGG